MSEAYIKIFEFDRPNSFGSVQFLFRRLQLSFNREAEGLKVTEPTVNEKGNPVLTIVVPAGYRPPDAKMKNWHLDTTDAGAVEWGTHLHIKGKIDKVITRDQILQTTGYTISHGNTAPAPAL